jgi:ribosomal protein L31
MSEFRKRTSICRPAGGIVLFQSQWSRMKHNHLLHMFVDNQQSRPCISPKLTVLSFKHPTFNGRNCYTATHFRIARYTIVKPSVFPTYSKEIFASCRHWGNRYLILSLSADLLVYAMSMSGVRCRIEHFGSAGLDYVCRIAWGNIRRGKKLSVHSYMTSHAQEY